MILSDFISIKMLPDRPLCKYLSLELIVFILNIEFDLQEAKSSFFHELIIIWFTFSASLRILAGQLRVLYFKSQRIRSFLFCFVFKG